MGLPASRGSRGRRQLRWMPRVAPGGGSRVFRLAGPQPRPDRRRSREHPRVRGGGGPRRAAPARGRRRTPAPRRRGPAGARPDRSASSAGATGRPARRRRSRTLSAWSSAGSVSGTPSVTESRGFSRALISSQASLTAAASPPTARAPSSGGEHVRVAPAHLLDDPAGDVVDRERAALLGDHRVEVDLQQQVAQLLAEVVEVARVDRLQRLVRLLEEVARQRPVGLLPLPAALRPQPPHVGEERHQRLTGGRAGHVSRSAARPAGSRRTPGRASRRCRSWRWSRPRGRGWCRSGRPARP